MADVVPFEYFNGMKETVTPTGVILLQPELSDECRSKGYADFVLGILNECNLKPFFRGKSLVYDGTSKENLEEIAERRHDSGIWEYGLLVAAPRLTDALLTAKTAVLAYDADSVDQDPNYVATERDEEGYCQYRFVNGPTPRNTLKYIVDLRGVFEAMKKMNKSTIFDKKSLAGQALGKID